MESRKHKGTQTKTQNGFRNKCRPIKYAVYQSEGSVSSCVVKRRKLAFQWCLICWNPTKTRDFIIFQTFMKNNAKCGNIIETRSLCGFKFGRSMGRHSQGVLYFIYIMEISQPIWFVSYLRTSLWSNICIKIFALAEVSFQNILHRYNLNCNQFYSP